MIIINVLQGANREWNRLRVIAGCPNRNQAVQFVSQYFQTETETAGLVSVQTEFGSVWNQTSPTLDWTGVVSKSILYRELDGFRPHSHSRWVSLRAKSKGFRGTTQLSPYDCHHRMEGMRWWFQQGMQAMATCTIMHQYSRSTRSRSDWLTLEPFLYEHCNGSCFQIVHHEVPSLVFVTWDTPWRFRFRSLCFIPSRNCKVSLS